MRAGSVESATFPLPGVPFPSRCFHCLRVFSQIYNLQLLIERDQSETPGYGPISLDGSLLTVATEELGLISSFYVYPAL